ncbi:hypothetical protein B296_00052853 [Ensete ventricosum]|uniref:Uncharacterized protein n=1 Tax=Ensete ventricosum TaxID=4639 RepID=A0A426XF87_ENSVE|nr:hypothetical protein B296_00052853 [Ensete ventricosum]
MHIEWTSVTCAGCPRCKAPSTRAAAPAREVDVSPVREAQKTSSKRLIDAPTEQADDPARRHKKVKVLTRRHKSRHDEGESRSHFKGKEPAAPSEEPDTPVESDEGDTSPVHHRPRSMKDLFKTKVNKGDAGYYTLQMSDLGHQDPDKEMKARWRGLKNSTKVWNDSSTAEEFERGLLHPQLVRELYTLPSEVLLARATKEIVLMALFDRVHDTGRLITFMDYRISQLQQELDALKSSGGPEAVTKAEERASELEHELEKTKRERDEALQQLEASKKELNESDFATELAQESGRLRELLRLGAMAALPQAGFLGSGLQATPFTGMPSGEPIGELPNLEFGQMGRAPGDVLGGRLLVVELRLGAFIATITGYPYLNLLSSLLLTIPLHLTMPSMVLAARRTRR